MEWKNTFPPPKKTLYRSHRKNFRIPILSLKREIIGISKDFFGETQNWESATKTKHGFLKSHFIPNNGIFFSPKFYPRMGYFWASFFPVLGLKLPNNGISRSQVLPNNGLFLGLVFPNIGIEISHPNSNRSRIDQQLLSSSTMIMHFLFKQF